MCQTQGTLQTHSVQTLTREPVPEDVTHHWLILQVQTSLSLHSQTPTVAKQHCGQQEFVLSDSLLGPLHAFFVNICLEVILFSNSCNTASTTFTHSSILVAVTTLSSSTAGPEADPTWHQLKVLRTYNIPIYYLMV